MVLTVCTEYFVLMVGESRLIPGMQGISNSPGRLPFIFATQHTARVIPRWSEPIRPSAALIAAGGEGECPVFQSR